MAPGAEGRVPWSSREEELTLGRTPVDLAEELAEKLWPKGRAALLTSATLSGQGSPNFVLSRLGLPLETPFS